MGVPRWGRGTLPPPPCGRAYLPWPGGRRFSGAIGSSLQKNKCRMGKNLNENSPSYEELSSPSPSVGEQFFCPSNFSFSGYQSCSCIASPVRGQSRHNDEVAKPPQVKEKIPSPLFFPTTQALFSSMFPSLKIKDRGNFKNEPKELTMKIFPGLFEDINLTNFISKGLMIKPRHVQLRNL